MRALGSLLSVALLALLAGAATGCTKDPCDGASGTCVSAHVEGSVRGLDQLRITVNGLGSQMTPTVPRSFTLPVNVAIKLPATAPSPAVITVDGLSAGRLVGTATDTITVAAGAKAGATFTLTSVSGPDDLGVGDGSVGDGSVGDGGDGGAHDLLPPPAVSIVPSSYTFQTIPRGTPSTDRGVFTFSNTTSDPVTLTTVIPDSGDPLPDFNPDPLGTTCPTNVTGATLAAHSSCTISFQWTPTQSGNVDVTLTLLSSLGAPLTLTLKGQATPSWTAANLSDLTINLSTVWASQTTSDVVVAGANTAGNMGGAYSYNANDGSNPWADIQLQTAPPNKLAGFSLSDLIISVPQGVEQCTSNTCTLYSPAPATTPAVAVAITGNQGAALLSNYLFKFGTSFAPNLVSLNAGESGTAVAVGNAGEIVWATSGAAVPAIYSSTRGTFTVPSALPASTTVKALSLSQDPSTHTFAVGTQNSAPFIWHWPTNKINIPPVVESAPGGGAPSAVTFRDLGNGILDVYVVGTFGNIVWHSTGDGNWTTAKVPNNSGMTDATIRPNGEVWAVGYNGEVTHYE